MSDALSLNCNGYSIKNSLRIVISIDMRADRCAQKYSLYLSRRDETKSWLLVLQFILKILTGSLSTTLIAEKRIV